MIACLSFNEYSHIVFNTITGYGTYMEFCKQTGELISEKIINYANTTATLH